MPKPIARWTPACNAFLFGYITGADFSRQISATDTTLFSQETIIRSSDFGGLRARNPGWFPSISEFARGRPDAGPGIDVINRRSEPGNTRLSKDDGSIASKLPQIILVLIVK